jgi:hypothetical protein
MHERLRFVARLLEGEKMAPLSKFAISWKTGYKDLRPLQRCGVQAFTDLSRRPYRQANRLPPQLEATIIRLKREYALVSGNCCSSAFAATDGSAASCAITVRTARRRSSLRTTICGYARLFGPHLDPTRMPAGFEQCVTHRRRARV